jgi:hypothetical protein
MIGYILDGEATCKSGMVMIIAHEEKKGGREWKKERKNKFKEVLHHKQASSGLDGMPTFPTPLFTTNGPSIMCQKMFLRGTIVLL